MQQQKPSTNLEYKDKICIFFSNTVGGIQKCVFKNAQNIMLSVKGFSFCNSAAMYRQGVDH